MSELQRVQGAVSATAQNSSDRYGVKIDGAWFDGEGECPVRRGDVVEIDFVESGRHRTIEAIREFGAAGRGETADAADCGEAAAADAQASVDARIARAVALKCATALSTGTGEDAEAVLERARVFEQWLRATPQ